MMFNYSLSLLILFFYFSSVYGHGRLIQPVPRQGPTAGIGNIANAPVSGYDKTDFVCRDSVAKNPHSFTAGSSINLKWHFTAKHVGDCALYVSYDVKASLAQMTWFKIANLPKCRLQHETEVPVTLPSWLPEGSAVFRWDWYALHQHPAVEYYAQCFDAKITSSAGSSLPMDLKTYKIVSPALYPKDANQLLASGKPGYRYPFGGPNADDYMTGPACAKGYAGNNCALTAKGTLGHIDVGTMGQPDNSVTPAPTARVAQTPAPTARVQTPAPTRSRNQSGCSKCTGSETCFVAAWKAGTECSAGSQTQQGCKDLGGVYCGTGGGVVKIETTSGSGVVKIKTRPAGSSTSTLSLVIAVLMMMFN